MPVGAVKWTFATGESVESSLAIANGVAYVASYNGILFALDARTSAEL
jgi:outer membrane protein assembly factor BamB